MKAVILAAGMGTRLEPLTRDLPKALVPVSGQPLLDRIISRLAEASIEEVIVVTGYLTEKIEKHLATCELPLAKGAKVVWNEKFAEWGNFYSLLVAEEAVAGESFLRIDGDLMLGPLTAKAIIGGSGPLRLALDCRSNLDAEAMKAQVNDSGRVIALNKGMDPAIAIGEAVGVDVVEAAACGPVFSILREMIELGETDDYYERGYELLAQRGFDVGYVDVHGDDSCEIDDIADLRAAEAALERIESRES